MNIDELEKKKKELEESLATPDVFSNPKKIKELSIELGRIEKALQVKQKGDGAGSKNEKLLVEIRAGAGGNEAALFAGELYRMYTAFIRKRGWEITPIDSSNTSLGGLKEIIFEVTGESAYKTLRNESGVHRVQRIPETEKSGRIHTSTASIAVLPAAEEKDIEIKPQDIKFEFFRVSGPGGQNVNKVETGVRIIHIPTGVIVSSQESRSQQQNRERALTVLRTKLLETQRMAEENKLANERKQQIGTAERVEKIRTYNFPQDRVTDHRIKKSFHNITSILDGNLDPLVEAFKKSP